MIATPWGLMLAGGGVTHFLIALLVAGIAVWLMT